MNEEDYGDVEVGGGDGVQVGGKGRGGFVAGKHVGK